MQNIVNRNHHEHDFDALRSASTRIVLAVGVESTRQLPGRAGIALAERLGVPVPGRAGIALAERLGVPVTDFPSHHAGFTGGEFGMTGEPDAFAARLREVLAEN